MFEVRRAENADEFEQALLAIGHYFGMEAGSEDVQRFARNLPVERAHAAFEDGKIVGGAGAFPFEFSIPGGRRENFQRGSISWNAATRATTVR